MSGEIGFNSYDDDNSSQYLDLITYKLEKLQAEERTIQANFQAWYKHRDVTIETIAELQKKINNLCVNANFVRGVGAVAGLASVVAGIVGLVLEAKGHDSADNFKKAGKYCGGASAVVMASSTIAEVGLSQSFINEIKRVVERDIELTKPLEKWVEFSREVDLLFKEHFPCSITSSIFPKVMEVIGYCIEALDVGQAEISDLQQNLKSCKIKTVAGVTIGVKLEVSVIVMDFLTRLYANPKFLSPLRNIWKIFKETPNVFEFAKLGSMIHCTIYKILNASRLSGLLSVAGIACPDFGCTFKRFAFDAVTFVANAITLILAAQNIKEGKSKYSDALDEILRTLRSEQERVHDLKLKYDEDNLGLQGLMKKFALREARHYFPDSNK